MAGIESSVEEIEVPDNLEDFASFFVGELEGSPSLLSLTDLEEELVRVPVFGKVTGDSLNPLLISEPVVPITRSFIAKDYTKVLERARFSVRCEDEQSIEFKSIRIGFNLNDSDVEAYKLKKKFWISVRIPATQVVDELFKGRTRQELLSVTRRLKNPEGLELISYLRSDAFIGKFCLNPLPNYCVTIHQEFVRICFDSRLFQMKSRRLLAFPLDCLKNVTLDKNRKHRIIVGLYRYLIGKNLGNESEFKQDEVTQAELNKIVNVLLTSKGRISLIRMPLRSISYKTRQSIVSMEEESDEEDLSESEDNTYTQRMQECQLSVKRSKPLKSTTFSFIPDEIMSLRVEFDLSFSVGGLFGPFIAGEIDKAYRRIIREILIETSYVVENDRNLSFASYLRSADFQGVFHDKVLIHPKTKEAKELKNRTASVFAPSPPKKPKLTEDGHLEP